jgi:mRNA interferase MazF
MREMIRTMTKREEANFDNWNTLKKSIQDGKKVEYFRERQVWWCSVGQNIGYEVYGKGKEFSRPVLVFKKLTQNSFLGVPLTSKDKTGSWYIKFIHRRRIVRAMLHQIRIFDKKRLIDRFGEVDDSDFAKIAEGFENFYCPKNIHPALRRESMGKSQK